MANTARRLVGASTLQECRAFVSFRGNLTVLILGSFGVTSITDNGTGDYTANWSFNFASASYCVPASLQGASSENVIINEDFSNAKTAGAFRCRTRVEDGGFTDAQKVRLIAYGAV